jgi:methionyl-tRNA synthetase
VSEPYYITTAINYPNGPPHIGHAYEAIAADVIARFRRAQGLDVRFQTGTDEHGLKMAQAARAQGVEPQALADKMSSLFLQMCEKLEISYDRFIRTSEPAHHVASQAIWTAMADRGDLYLGRYEGWYSVRDEAYYDEGELSNGEGGQKLSPQGSPVEWTVEESWFFRLSAYQQKLLDHYSANPDFIRPESRRNEVVRFVEGGLSDLSISRTSFDWGVKVPGSDEHVMYVWLDALTNYITGLGYPEETEPWRRYWPADVHLIGKDVVRFHAVYWPAFLMSAGIELPLPRGLRPWLPAEPRREDVEERRQRRRPDGAGRAVRGRSAALFPDARSPLRPGRHLFAGRSSTASMPSSRTASATSPSAPCR